MGRDSVRIHGVGLVHSPLSVAIVKLGQNGSHNLMAGMACMRTYIIVSYYLTAQVAESVPCNHCTTNFMDAQIL